MLECSPKHRQQNPPVGAAEGCGCCTEAHVAVALGHSSLLAGGGSAAHGGEGARLGLGPNAGSLAGGCVEVHDETTDGEATCSCAYDGNLSV